MCNIITLITDFGVDYYPGVVKGVIATINPAVKVIDITHQIRSYDISAGAYVLECSYKYFPKGSIHLVVVDPGVGSARDGVIVEAEGYYFIGPDNGLFGWLTQLANRIIKLDNKPEYCLSPIDNTFHARDIFAPTAAYLSSGVDIDQFGRPVDKLVPTPLPRVEVTKNIIKGEIIYIDHFGNLITNITKNILKNDAGINIKINNHVIDGIVRCYDDVKKGEILALWGSSGRLEISVNQGSAKDMLDTDVGASVIITQK
jgi:hypothetical protein